MPGKSFTGRAPSADTLARGLGWRLIAATRDLIAHFGLLGHVERLRNYSIDRRRSQRAKQLVPPIIARLAARADKPDSAHWRVNKVIPTVSDVLVVKAGPAERPSEALIKIAETPTAAKGLKWQVEALTRLTGDTRLGEWRDLLPRVLDAGETGTSAYLVETRVTGVNLERSLHDPVLGDAAIRDAAAAIGHLHNATAEPVAIGRDHLDRWVREPIRILIAATERASGHRPTGPALERLSAECCTALERRDTTVSWVHGDYGPGNILMGSDGQISGIVDWEFAQPADFPSLDIVTLVLTVRMHMRRHELGRVVCDLLSAPRWSTTEDALIAAAPDASTWQTLGAGRVVLLCWLRHTAWMIERCSRYAASGLWLHTNIHMVLEALEEAR